MASDTSNFARYTLRIDFVEPDLSTYPLADLAESQGVEEQTIRSQLLRNHANAIQVAAERINELLAGDDKLQAILSDQGIQLQTGLSVE